MENRRGGIMLGSTITSGDGISFGWEQTRIEAFR